MEIKDKVALITGASSGIGECTARLFHQKGAKVVLAARSELKIKFLEEQLGSDCLAVVTDVRDREQIDRLITKTVKRFSRIDILINNAGVGCVGSVENMNLQNVHSVLDTNVFGPLMIMQAVIPVMSMTGGGLIMNVSSMITKISRPGSGAYRASKCALDALSEAARLELKSKNIRVTTVYPGLTDTPFFRNALGISPAGRKAGSSSKRRMRTPQFVAHRILEGARREPRIVYMGLRSILGAAAYGLMPSLLERLSGKGKT